MASTTIKTFTSSLGSTIPTFTSQGSHIATPDLQIVFWGPYWPGAGQLSVAGIMQAVNTIVSGPFLEGLGQYGYTGPVNVRQPIVNTGNPNYTYPALGPNVDQSLTTLRAVQILVETLRQSNAMGDVSSNHDLIVFVFLDPSIPFPQSQDSAGIVTTIWGAHGEHLVSQDLAPAIRFCVGWSGTQPSGLFSAFDKTTWTFSHELAEAISDPFGVNGTNTGWVQTFPKSPGNQGEIGDICNQIYCVVDSIVVQPYWGVAQANCILPIETRTLSLNQVLTKHVPQDGPTQYGLVDLGPLCGKGNFDYVERTWDNVVSVSAVHPGYQAPAFTWSINGAVLKAGNSIITVPAEWDRPTAPGYRSSLGDTPRLASDASLIAAAGAGMPHRMMAVRQMSSLGSVPPASHLDPTPKAPAGALTQVQNLPAGDVFDKSLAPLHVTVFESVMTIECGPGAGNVSFSVECQAVENWDNNPNATVTTNQSTSANVTMTNQQIVWGTSLQKAMDDCYAKTHKATGGGNPVRPQNPGDPGPQGGAGRAEQVQQMNQVRQASQINKLE